MVHVNGYDIPGSLPVPAVLRTVTGRSTAVTIAALIAGAGATSWIYLNGIFSAPSQVGATSYVSLATITPATIAFHLMGLRSHADASQPPPHLIPN